MPPLFADLGLVTQGTTAAWAVTSPDDLYRYVLGRAWDDLDDGKRVHALWVFGCMNPSKASHEIDDHTVRKMTGLAKRGGACGFMVVNAMARRETHPEKLAQAHSEGTDVIGPHNEAVLRWALNKPFGFHSLSIAAWGALPKKLRPLAAPAMKQFDNSVCFGTTKDGSPRHPLMLAYSTPLVAYSARTV